jgi:hypothetical protein
MRVFKNDEEEAAYHKIVATWFLPPGVSVVVPKARKLMYGKLMDLQRRRIDIWGAIFEELEREGIGSGRPWHERYEAIAKAREERIEAWQDAQLGIDPPEPKTPLEHLLQEHHRLLWAEWNLCDGIEKRWGAVSPLYDTRPDAVPRPCPH